MFQFLKVLDCYYLKTTGLSHASPYHFLSEDSSFSFVSIFIFLSSCPHLGLHEDTFVIYILNVFFCFQHHENTQVM